MKTIRNSLFETNSSSIHSICICNKKSRYTEQKFSDVCLDEYGWSYGDDDMLRTPLQKLSYLFTYAIERLMNYDKDLIEHDKSLRYPDGEYNDDYDNDFIERINEYIHDRNSEFSQYKETEGIDFLVNFVKDHCDDFSEFNISDRYGFNIDHQSVESETLLELINGINFDDLIFNDKYAIEISNDNK